MDKDVQKIVNRFHDLAEQSYMQNVFTFTGFLNLAEQSVFFDAQNEFAYVGWKLFGGNEDCERKILRFGSVDQLGYEEEYPIACIHIYPPIKKFAEALTHRDYLGALINLGIDRTTLGDILVQEKEAWLYCQNNLKEFICDKLLKVKHTNVVCKEVDMSIEVLKKELKSEEYIVNSMRIDAILSKVYALSRQKSLNLMAEKKVYISGRLCENPARVLKDHEMITARGFGRFIFNGKKYETKKGKFVVGVEVYQ